MRKGGIGQSGARNTCNTYSVSGVIFVRRGADPLPFIVFGGGIALLGAPYQCTADSAAAKWPHESKKMEHQNDNLDFSRTI